MLNSFIHVSGERNLLFHNFILFFHITFKQLLNAESVFRTLTNSAHSCIFVVIFQSHTVFKKAQLAPMSLRRNEQQQVLTERRVRWQGK